MKKNKKHLVYGFLFIFVLPLVAFTSTTSAYEGSRTSATQKEWFYVLEGCAKQSLAYKIDANIISVDFWNNFNTGFLLNPDNAKNGNWFEDSAVLTPNKNPYIEAQVEGSYGDGQFYCGHKDNALTKRAAKSIGFVDNYEEVICSGDNFKNPGLLAYNVEGTCHGAYNASDSSGTYFTNVNNVQHLVDVANKKIDSTFDVKELSPLEKYFVRHDAFKYACVKGASPLEYAQTKAELAGTYPYVIYEDHDGVAEYAGYNEAGNIDKTTYIDYFYNQGAQCQEIAAELSEKNTDLDEYLADKGGTNEDIDTEDACYNAGLDSVSYIVCPAIDNTTSVVDEIENVLRTLLEINPNNAFSPETYNAWNIFRNIANIFLTIIFMIIIFSQLTGYGIDNYGIKKMLPRLITMAIIINLSYIVCELAVDLSNILGSGLYELFKGIGITVNEEAASSDVGTIVSGILGAVGGSSVPIAGAIIAGVAAGGGVMIVISLVLLLLVALVAVVIVFLMLGVRMAIVILFVAISPVAFALYILPNTQNLFKKYWKVAEAALVVFPICGAVCGASFIIRAIIFSSTAENDVVQIVTALVGLCAPFLPFFLLPNLLKSVLGGLGAIGGVLSGIGNGLRKGTQGLGDTVKSGVKNSAGYQEKAQERARTRLLNRTNKGIDKLEGRKNLSASEQRLLARRYQTKDKLENEDRAAKTILADRTYANATMSELGNKWDDAFMNGDKQQLDALTSIISSRYGAAGANEIANRLAAKDITKDEKAQNMMETLRYNMNHDSTLANNMRNKAADAYNMISNGGQTGRDQDGKPTYGNISAFPAGDIATSTKDWSTQSTGTLKRAIDSGSLSQNQINQMLSSTDPSIQSGIQSDMDKLNVLQASVQGAKKLSNMEKSEIERYAKQYRETQEENLAQAQATARAEVKQAQEVREKFYEDTSKALQELNEQLKSNKPQSDESFGNGNNKGAGI